MYINQGHLPTTVIHDIDVTDKPVFPEDISTVGNTLFHD